MGGSPTVSSTIAGVLEISPLLLGDVVVDCVSKSEDGTDIKGVELESTMVTCGIDFSFCNVRKAKKTTRNVVLLKM